MSTELSADWSALECHSNVLSNIDIWAITCYNWLMRRCFTDDKELEITEKYRMGQSPYVLAKIYQSNPKTIYNVLHRKGLFEKAHDGRRLSGAYRRTTLDESVFDVINEESAYWIGFLMADGCIFVPHNKSPRIQLRLSAKDRLHVYKFRSFLSSSVAISKIEGHKYGYPGGTTQYALSVTSSKLASVLGKYGVIPRKSLNARVKTLQGNRHFWRGMIDGDGYIWIHPTTRKVKLGLVGALALLTQFKVFVRSFCPEFNGAVRRMKNIYSVQISSNMAKTMIREIYGRCSVSLPRKQSKAWRALCVKKI